MFIGVHLFNKLNYISKNKQNSANVDKLSNRNLYKRRKVTNIKVIDLAQKKNI